MSIAEVAASLGTTARALRYYEDKGLLRPARSSGQSRCYSGYDLTLAEHIVVLRKVGVGIDDIRNIERVESDRRLDALTKILEKRRVILLSLIEKIDDLLLDKRRCF